MVTNTEGIVLRNTRYGDSVNIVTLYTQSEGILTFSVRNKNANTGNKALLSPLSVVNIVSDIRKNRSIHNPKEISLSVPYCTIPYNPSKGCVVMFLNELLVKVLKEEEPNNFLYRFLKNMLMELDVQDPLHPSFHLSVMLKLTSYLGFFPGNATWAPGFCFDLREGTFVNSVKNHNDYADPEMSRVINDFICIPFDEYQQYRSDRIQRVMLLDLLIKYYQLHVPGFGHMKSVDVLRAIYE